MSAAMLMEFISLLGGPLAAGSSLAECQHVTPTFLAGVYTVRSLGI